MGGEFIRSDLFSIDCVDDPYSTAAKAHINSFRCAIVTHVVGVIGKIHFANKLKGIGIIDVANSPFIICDEQAIQLRNKCNSLGRSEATDRVNALAFVQVDYFDSVIAQRANKQSFAGCIEIEVIYSSFDSGQWDRLLQLDPGVTGFSDCETTSGYSNDDGEN
jgi:hypothetical protein